MTIYIPVQSWELLGFIQVNEEIDSYITKNSTSLSALGSIFSKNFWEPMSVDVRVILLVEGDIMGKHLRPYIESETLRAYACMYTMITDASTRR